MKNMKRILALVCIALLAMTATCFALEADQSINLLLKSDKATISAGDTFTVTIYSDNYTATETLSTASAYIYFDSNKFEIEGSIPDSQVSGYNSKIGVFGDNISVDFSNIGSYTFTAKSDLADGDYTMCLYEVMFMDNDGNMNNFDEALCTDELKITVGSTEKEYPYVDTEEVFTDGTIKKDGETFITTTAATKAVSVFGKAPEGGLKAGKYGAKVVMNNKTYNFAGLKDVSANGIWVVKIISPDGTFKFSDKTTVMATDNVSSYVVED